MSVFGGLLGVLTTAVLRIEDKAQGARVGRQRLFQSATALLLGGLALCWFAATIHP